MQAIVDRWDTCHKYDRRKLLSSLCFNKMKWSTWFVSLISVPIVLCRWPPWGLQKTNADNFKSIEFLWSKTFQQKKCSVIWDNVDTFPPELASWNSSFPDGCFYDTGNFISEGPQNVCPQNWRKRFNFFLWARRRWTIAATPLLT